jgi:hypothetical protein
VRVCLNGHVHLYSKYDNDFKHYQAVTAENHFQPYRYEYPKDSDLVRVPFNVFYPTLEEYMWEYHGIKRDEHTGKFGSWQNPNAAAKAVFALLDVMHSKGALSSPTSYQISWAGTQAKRSFEPFDWTEDLQWTKQGAQLTPATYQAQVIKQGQMTDFASLNVIYTSAEAKASPKGVLNVTREYFVRFTQDGVQKLRPVKEGDAFKVGDEVEVHLTLTADSAFEYVQLTDPKPAGFENKELLSGWTWKPVSMYQEVRDADTNFFIDRLPAGQVKLHYVLRPTVPGKFHAKPAQIQSMYAPEYGAHSAAETVQVNK